mmetsp:Transcript_10128/g.26001  ORF Transcript_10128/g.26001 Transcript_10128/m.26001 type:complete len:304 (+) Transcript_10128:83-994(+)
MHSCMLHATTDPGLQIPLIVRSRLLCSLAGVAIPFAAPRDRATTSAVALGSVVPNWATILCDPVATTSALDGARVCPLRRRRGIRVRGRRRDGGCRWFWQLLDDNAFKDGRLSVAFLGAWADPAVEPVEAVFRKPRAQRQNHAIGQRGSHVLDVVHRGSYHFVALGKGEHSLQDAIYGRKFHPEHVRLLAVDGEAVARAVVSVAVSELDPLVAAVRTSPRLGCERRCPVVGARVARRLEGVNVHLHQVELGAAPLADAICVTIVAAPDVLLLGRHRNKEEGNIAPTRWTGVAEVNRDRDPVSG